jgi:hypothetical protein
MMQYYASTFALQASMVKLEEYGVSTRKDTQKNNKKGRLTEPPKIFAVDSWRLERNEG